MSKKFWIGLVFILAFGLGSAFYIESQDANMSGASGGSKSLQGNFSVTSTASSGYYAYLSVKTENDIFINSIQSKHIESSEGEDGGSFASINLSDSKDYYVLKFTKDGLYKINLDYPGMVGKKDLPIKAKSFDETPSTQEIILKFSNKIYLKDPEDDSNITNAKIKMGADADIPCLQTEDYFLCQAPINETNYNVESESYLTVKSKFLTEKRNNYWDDQQTRTINLQKDPNYQYNSNLEKADLSESDAYYETNKIDETEVFTAVSEPTSQAESSTSSEASSGAKTESGAESEASSGAKTESGAEPETSSGASQNTSSDAEPEKCIHPFTDLEAWYEEAICWAYQKNLIKGTSETKASPTKKTNLAQAIVAIIRASGNEQTALNLQVNSSEWYAPYVQFADKNNWISSESFEPTRHITRAEFIVMLAKASGKTFYDFNDSKLPKDVSMQDEFAWAVALAIKDSVAKGRANGNFEPYKNLNRAEMASFLKNAFDANWF